MTNEEIFEKNVNIAYKIANRYITNYYNEIEDIRQIALMELWRCIENWDHIHSLTTYAYICIPSKINYYLRQNKKREKDISIHTVIYDDGGIETTIEDYLDTGYDQIEHLIDDINAEGVLNKINVTDKEKEVLRLRMVGLSQREISKIIHTSQPQVSRYQKLIKRKISNILNKGGEIQCQNQQIYLMKT